MTDYTFRSTTDRGKLSEFTLKITTDRSAAALYENDRLILNFSYIWRTTTSTSTTTSTTYVPKAIHFFLAPNVCSTSSIPKIQEANVYDLGTFQFGNFISGGRNSVGPITKIFNLSQENFNIFLSATTSTDSTITDSTIKTLAAAGSYIDQTPVYLKIGYEIDYGDYKPGTLNHGFSTSYKPQYYGNLGISIKGEIERCDETGGAIEQGEYIHWSSLYIENLAPTLYNNTQPSTYITNVENIRIGVEQKYGDIVWQDLLGEAGINTNNILINKVIKADKTTSENDYSETDINISASILNKKFTKELSSNVIIQISFRSNLNGIYTGNFTIDRAQAKLHISGWPDGGVAIGKFSNSTAQRRPLFEVDESHESYFGGPVNFNQGINTVGGNYCMSSLNALGVQTGYWVAPATMSANPSQYTLAASKSKFYNVDFARPYSSIPIVVTTLFNTTDSSNPATIYNCNKCTSSIESITNTGFSLKILNISSSKRYPNFTWMAIGNIIEGDKDSKIRRPDANRAMTRNNEGNLIAAASSVYKDSSSYTAYRAFNNNTSSYWRSKANVATLWIGLYFEEQINNITVEVDNYASAHPRGVHSGFIQIANARNRSDPFNTNYPYNVVHTTTFENWNETGFNSIKCGNSQYGNMVILNITKFYDGSGNPVPLPNSNYCQIGQISITGTLKNNSGGSSEEGGDDDDDDETSGA